MYCFFYFFLLIVFLLCRLIEITEQSTSSAAIVIHGQQSHCGRNGHFCFCWFDRCHYADVCCVSTVSQINEPDQCHRTP